MHIQLTRQFKVESENLLEKTLMLLRVSVEFPWNVSPC